MGIFHDMVQVRNLAPIPLNITFDGQTTSIPPGVSSIPKVTLSNAMNQNPVMGTADAWNPNISGGKYLIVPVGTKYDRDPLTKEEWEAHLKRPCRMDEVAYFAESLDSKQRVITRGVGKRTQAKSLYEAGVQGGSIKTVDGIPGE